MHFSPSDTDCCGNILADAVKSRHKPRASDICEESGENRGRRVHNIGASVVSFQCLQVDYSESGVYWGVFYRNLIRVPQQQDN